MLFDDSSSSEEEALLLWALAASRRTRNSRSNANRTLDTSSAADSSSLDSADSSIEDASSDDGDQPMAQSDRVRPPPGNVTAPDPVPDCAPVHRTIECNKCGVEVVGFHYKCLQCPDYDLCAACEARGAHPDHYVLRIPRPLQLAQARVLVERMHCCLDAEGLLQTLNSQANDRPTDIVRTTKQKVHVQPASKEITNTVEYVEVEPQVPHKTEPTEDESHEEHSLEPEPFTPLPPASVSDSRHNRKRKAEEYIQGPDLVKVPTPIRVKPEPTVDVKIEPILEEVAAEDPLAPDLDCRADLLAPDLDCWPSRLPSYLNHRAQETDEFTS